MRWVLAFLALLLALGGGYAAGQNQQPVRSGAYDDSEIREQISAAHLQLDELIERIDELESQEPGQGSSGPQGPPGPRGPAGPPGATDTGLGRCLSRLVTAYERHDHSVGEGFGGELETGPPDARLGYECIGVK